MTISETSPQAIRSARHTEASPGGPKTSQVHGSSGTHVTGDLALDFPGGQRLIDAHASGAVEGQASPQAIQHVTPTVGPPAGPKTGRDHPRSDAQWHPVPASNLPGDHSGFEAQNVDAAGDQTPPPAIGDMAPSGSSLGVDEQGPQVPAIRRSDSTPGTPELADPLLALAADVLDDLEKVRIANENRLRQLTRDEIDSDGEERGFGLTEDHPDVARLAALVDALAKAEKDATKNLEKRLKQHPLAPWLAAQKGVGAKQGARLLAAIGDPYWNTLHDRPRTVSELWAYCGYHVLPAGHSSTDTQMGFAGGSNTSHPDQERGATQSRVVGVAPKRARGQKANWSRAAKLRAYLIAESAMKQLKRDTCPPDEELGYALHTDGCACGHYRKVYDAARLKYANALHEIQCARCGPKGTPAAAGSPLSRKHKQARALRAVAKELLKDLWREAKQIHDGA